MVDLQVEETQDPDREGGIGGIAQGRISRGKNYGR